MGVWQSTSATVTSEQELTKLIELRNGVHQLLTELDAKQQAARAELVNLEVRIAQAQTELNAKTDADVEAPAVEPTEIIQDIQGKIDQVNALTASLKVSQDQ